LRNIKSSALYKNKNQAKYLWHSPLTKSVHWMQCELQTQCIDMHDDDGKEEGKGRRRINNYHGHYSSGFSTQNPTKPGVLITEAYFGILILNILTPVGKIQVVGYGGMFASETQLIVDHDLFDLAFIKPMYEDSTGPHGPWHQIIRVSYSSLPANQ